MCNTLTKKVSYQIWNGIFILAVFTMHENFPVYTTSLQFINRKRQAYKLLSVNNSCNLSIALLQLPMQTSAIFSRRLND